MNDTISEQILDSLLEEMLTDQHPPDLSTRIQAAWSHEQEHGRKMPRNASADLVKAVLVDSPEVRHSKPAVEKTSSMETERNGERHVSGPVELDRTQVDVADRRSGGISQRRRLVASLLATVAAGFVVLLGFKALNSVTDSPIAMPIDEVLVTPENSGSPAEGSEKSAIQMAQAVPPTAGGESAAASERAIGELMDLRNLPFDSQIASAGNENKVVESERLPPGVRLPMESVIDGLDRQLVAVWNQVGVEPSPKLTDGQLAEKIHQTLVGREVPASVAKQLVTSETELDTRRWVRSVTGLSDFPQHWSRKVSRQWLKKTSISLESDAADVLSRFVAQSISRSTPWNAVLRKMLGGELDSEADSPSPSTTFVSALAGGGNHRLVRRIGNNFLNVNLACVRCHDAKLANIGPSWSKQQTYWSIVALFKGIDATGNGFRESRQVSDGQEELFSRDPNQTVFYDLLDGQLKAATARLPGGADWRERHSASPRVAMANWLSESESLDQAVVNQTWKLIFGRHLVPQVEGIDVAATESRREILRFLAAQFRAHDHDMKKLVTWLVCSDAFSRSSQIVDRKRWLELEDDQLESQQLAELVFASGNTLGITTEARSLNESLVALMRWSHPQTKLDSGNTIFAQPDLQAKPPRRIGPGLELKIPSSSFVVHGEHHTRAERAFVERILKSSRLSWEQRVEHIVALSEYEVANSRIQKLAKDVLQRNAGDAEQTLLDLLWSVENSDHSEQRPAMAM